jgi:hypothetical protein
MVANKAPLIQISMRLTPPGEAACPETLIACTDGKISPSSGTSIQVETLPEPEDAGRLQPASILKTTSSVKRDSTG